MERGRRVFGIIMICVSLLALFSWEKFGRAHFYYDDILILRSDVQRGKKITSDMLKTVKTDRVQKDMLKPADRKKLCGKCAVQFVHRGAPLYREYFCEEELLTGKKYGTYRICIPERWILSCPDDLQRGDKIHVISRGERIADARVLSRSADSQSVQAVVKRSQAGRIERAAAENHGLVICGT